MNILSIFLLYINILFDRMLFANYVIKDEVTQEFHIPSSSLDQIIYAEHQ